MVLMLGGDSDVARRAGDSLIRDKVDEALTEGGFESIAFDAWERGFEGRRFWMDFSNVDVVREGTRLKARSATVYPISVRIQFSGGDVTDLSGRHAWHFDDVEVSGNSGFFSRSVGIYGRDLTLTHGDAGISEPFCLFAGNCAYKVAFGGEALDEFGLELTRRGREATLRFIWREDEGCVVLGVHGVSIERGAALSSIGRAMLENGTDADVSLEQGACELEQAPGREHGRMVGVTARSKEVARWAERDRRLDEMLGILLVSVPEAYEFLVD